jgi:hypothetical protein
MYELPYHLSIHLSIYLSTLEIILHLGIRCTPLSAPRHQDPNKIIGRQVSIAPFHDYRPWMGMVCRKGRYETLANVASKWKMATHGRWPWESARSGALPNIYILVGVAAIMTRDHTVDVCSMWFADLSHWQMLWTMYDQFSFNMQEPYGSYILTIIIISLQAHG